MKKVILFISLIMVLISCNMNEEEVRSYDTANTLKNWSENVIIPAYQNYSTKTLSLVDSVKKFNQDNSVTNLLSLRGAWEDAYIAYQSVELSRLGKAQLLDINNYCNRYPVNAIQIESNIESQNYDLSLTSFWDQQGYPALDYLLNGSAATDTEIATLLSDTKYEAYLTDVIERINSIAAAILDDWQTTYSEGFTGDDQFDNAVNVFIDHFNKFLKSNKISEPAGVYGFSNSKAVEAYYKNDLSKTLFSEGLKSSRDFFEGKSFDGGSSGESIKSLLVDLGRSDLSNQINNQYDVIEIELAGLDNSFADQISDNNVAMTKMHDQLQTLVVLFRVDMASALDVSIVIADADGD